MTQQGKSRKNTMTPFKMYLLLQARMSRIDCNVGKKNSFLHHTTNAISETPWLGTVIETTERLL